MDYIPGGDLMSLLIKLGIFEEPLARLEISSNYGMETLATFTPASVERSDIG